MLFNIYEQRAPIRVGNDKRGVPVFEMDIRFVDSTFATNSDEAIKVGKEWGITYPIVECINGYDADGNPRKGG